MRVTEISFDIMEMYCVPNLPVTHVQQILSCKNPTVFKDWLNETSSDNKLSYKYASRKKNDNQVNYLCITCVLLYMFIYNAH